MLDAKRNRMDYGEQLIPPEEGYGLDYAVGTTYSLDLEAIMVLPVALFYSRLLDCSPDHLHYDVLDAITRASEKIRVYCQKGKIKTPKKYNHLMAYWEQGIASIAMDSAFESFHPKVWIVRFTKPEHPACYRLLITSRNLTYTHDWDIAFSTEGYISGKDIPKNQPLIDFLKYLQGKDDKPLPNGFIEDLIHVDFDLPDGFKLMNFHPIGINGKSTKNIFVNPLQKRTWDSLLVLSPFIDDKSINHFSEKTTTGISILSRKEELDKISPEILKDPGYQAFWQFSEFIRDAEMIEGIADGTRLEALPQNLHAKVFIGSKGDYTYWFLGSANATQPAMTSRNIEFLVELKTDQSKYSPNKIAKMLTNPASGEMPFFEKYNIKNRIDSIELQNIESEMRSLVYDITCLCFEGNLVTRSLGSDILFDLVITCYAQNLAISDDFSVCIRPLPEFSRDSTRLEEGIVNVLKGYIGYREVQLSPYLIIEIYYKNDLKKSFIVEMKIELPSSRMTSIFKTIINNREKFIKYLSFLLSGTTPEPLDTGSGSRILSESKINTDKSGKTIAIYENLMISASRYPGKIEAIDKMIEKLNETSAGEESIVSPDFIRLWNVFLEYTKWNRNAK